MSELTENQAKGDYILRGMIQAFGIKDSLLQMKKMGRIEFTRPVPVMIFLGMVAAQIDFSITV